MFYTEFPPSPALERYIECFWSISSKGMPAPADAGTIMPDGAVELVLNFGEIVERRQNDRPNATRLKHMVVGQMDHCARVDYKGAVDLLGVRFHPAGAFPFFNVPANEYSGQILRLDDLTRHLEGQIQNRIDPGWSMQARMAELQNILIDSLREKPQRDHTVELAVRIIQRAQGQISISALLSEIGVSKRHLERKFQQSVGLSPKLLGRILRFRHAWEKIDDPGPRDWAGLALSLGYYDQAHLIRDFNQFAGGPPGRLASQYELAED